MATSQLQDSASLEVSGLSVHNLAVPFKEVVPIDNTPYFEWWSANLANREVVTIGSGVREALVTIRMENEPDELKALLREAIYSDKTVTYEKTVGGTEYDFKVVAIIGTGGAVELQPDRDRYGFGEYECRLHIRRVDGGSLDGLL